MVDMRGEDRQGTARTGAPTRVETIGFYTGWSAARGFEVRDLETSVAAGRLTMVNYAFADVRPRDPDREPDPETNPVIVVAERPYWDFLRSVPAGGKGSEEAGAPPSDRRLGGNFAQLRALKGRHCGLRVVLSIGGWIESRYFSDGALTARSREVLVRSAVDTFLRGNLPTADAVRAGDPAAIPAGEETAGGGPGAAQGVFDGFDIDWEFPACPGNEGNRFRPEDEATFPLLLAEFRRQMDALSRETGRNYVLTADLPAGADQARHIDVPGALASVDWLNLMTYDFAGPWEPHGPARSHSPLLPARPGRLPGDPIRESAVETVRAYEARGATPDRLVLGVPFYAHGWFGVDPGETFGHGEPAEGPVAVEGEAHHWRMLRDRGYPSHRDPETGSFWFYDPEGRTFWGLDDPVALAVKGTFARTEGLRGIMIWSLESDDADGSLLRGLTCGLRLGADSPAV